MLARLVHSHGVRRNARDSLDGDEEVPLAQSEEAACGDLKHPHFSLTSVDEKSADMPDVLILPIDHFAVSNVLIRLGNGKVNVGQFHKDVVLSFLDAHEVCFLVAAAPAGVSVHVKGNVLAWPVSVRFRTPEACRGVGFGCPKSHSLCPFLSTKIP